MGIRLCPKQVAAFWGRFSPYRFITFRHILLPLVRLKSATGRGTADAARLAKRVDGQGDSYESRQRRVDGRRRHDRQSMIDITTLR